MGESPLREEDFASHECLEDIKAYSSLLQQCDMILPCGPYAVLPITSEERKGIHRATFNRVQSKVNILARNHEILAVVYSGIADIEDSKGVVSDSGNVILAIHPVKDAHEQSCGMVASPLKVFIKAHSGDFGGTTWTVGAEPVEHLLQRYGEIAASDKGNAEKPKNSDVSFAEHFHIVKSLLLECHDAATEKTLGSVRQRLRDYIMASSHQKMLRRLEMGQSHRGRDFYNLLILDVMLPEFDQDDIPELDVLQRLPTSFQMAMFKSYADSVNRPDLISRKAENPVYRKVTRKLLRAMLRDFLLSTEKALKALRSSMRLAKLAKISQEGANIMPLVVTARIEVQNLTYFVLVFEDVLLHHFQWLEQQFRNRATESTAATADDGDVGTSGTGNNDDDDDDKDHEDIEMDMLVNVRQLADLERSEKGWAKGAIKYLRLICLHEISILEATNWKPEKSRSAKLESESQLLTRSNFTVGDVQYYSLDQTRKSFDACLDELVSKKANLNKARIMQLLARQRKHDEWVPAEWMISDEKFQGTFHCETILLMLAILASRPEIAQNLTQEWLHRNGIFAAASDLLKLFSGMLPFVAISKRDCPVCHRICEFIAESGALKGSKKLIIPGHHTMTSAVALPPFTPKDIAEDCLRDIMSKVDERMRRLQDIVDNDGNIPSDVGPESDEAALEAIERQKPPRMDRSEFQLPDHMWQMMDR